MYRHNREYDPDRPLIQLQNVSKRFLLHRAASRSIQERFIRLLSRKRQESERDSEQAHFWSLRDVTLDVHPGDSIGVIGPNGSGKSTLLKLISGILEPTTGNVLVNGPMSSLLELGAGFHPDLTGRENIYLNASIYGLNRRAIDAQLDSIIAFSELAHFIDMPVKHYSSGMYVRLGFAVAIHTNPKLLLVDEVLAVGDAHFQAKCMDAIQHFRDGDGTLLLVSHDLTSISNLCSRAIWFDHGTIQATGTPLDVIMAYKNRLAEEDNQAQEQSTHGLDSDRRWGTGDIEITGVELCDRAGTPQNAFFSEEPLLIRIAYRAQQPVRGAIFGLAIQHQSGLNIAGPNTLTGGLALPTIAGTGELVYQIPSLPLLEGAYQLSVASTNRTGSITYDYHDRLYPLRVYPGACQERHGTITLNGSWTFQPSTSSSLQQKLTRPTPESTPA